VTENRAQYLSQPSGAVLCPVAELFVAEFPSVGNSHRASTDGGTNAAGAQQVKLNGAVAVPIAQTLPHSGQTWHDWKQWVWDRRIGHDVRRVGLEWGF
jgi:hypothetical protein